MDLPVHSTFAGLFPSSRCAVTAAVAGVAQPQLLKTFGRRLLLRGLLYAVQEVSYTGQRHACAHALRAIHKSPAFLKIAQSSVYMLHVVPEVAGSILLDQYSLP